MSRINFSCNTGWTIYDGVSDVIPDPLWRYARRVSRITYAYRGLPALAFAFHGWQRTPFLAKVCTVSLFNEPGPSVLSILIMS
jgi:hypothetical protein